MTDGMNVKWIPLRLLCGNWEAHRRLGSSSGTRTSPSCCNEGASERWRKTRDLDEAFAADFFRCCCSYSGSKYSSTSSMTSSSYSSKLSASI